MPAFLEIVKETVCDAVHLEDAAADNYNSNGGSSHQDRVCFGVRLCQPAKQGCIDHGQEAKRDFQPSDFFLDSVDSRHLKAIIACIPSLLMD